MQSQRHSVSHTLVGKILRDIDGTVILLAMGDRGTTFGTPLHMPFQLLHKSHDKAERRAAGHWDKMAQKHHTTEMLSCHDNAIVTRLRTDSFPVE